MLKISNLTGETLESLNWNMDENSDSTWHLQDTLVIGEHVYENTDGNEITEDDISQEFLENNTNFCCTVFLKENSGLYPFARTQNSEECHEEEHINLCLNDNR